jgi:hypothetical protein
MPLYTFLHNLLNVLVQIANEMDLKKSMAEEGNILYVRGVAFCTVKTTYVHLSSVAW